MQLGEAQKMRLPLPLMPLLDAVRHVLLHTLRSRPLVQPTTGRAMNGCSSRQGRQFPLEGSVEGSGDANAHED
jgi:hypothetical protein